MISFKTFSNLSFKSSFVSDTRDRTVFASEGVLQQITGDLLLQKSQAAYQHPQLELYASSNTAHGGAIKFSAMYNSKYQLALIKAYGGSGSPNSSGGSLGFSTGDGTEKLRIHADGRIMPNVVSGRGGVGMVGAFMARPSATYSKNSGTEKVTLNTEEFDANGWFNTSNYRYTPQCKGWYQFNFYYQIRTNINSQSIELYLYPYKNGSAANGGPVHGWNTNYGNYAHITFSTMIYMNGSSDYLEMFGNSSRSTEVSVNSRMSGFLVHPVA